MAHRLPLKDHIFISEFAAFCREKGDEAYYYGDAFNCALAQFLKATGRWDSKELPCGLYFFSRLAWMPADGSDLYHALNTGRRNGHNFAALATRLESLLSDMTVGVGQ